MLSSQPRGHVGKFDGQRLEREAERVQVCTNVFDGSATTAQTIHDLCSVQHIHQTVACERADNVALTRFASQQPDQTRGVEDDHSDRINSISTDASGRSVE